VSARAVSGRPALWKVSALTALHQRKERLVGSCVLWKPDKNTGIGHQSWAVCLPVNGTRCEKHAEGSFRKLLVLGPGGLEFRTYFDLQNPKPIAWRKPPLSGEGTT